MGSPEVTPVHSKTLLRRIEFGRGPVEYTVNLYKGCTHACVYCYAPSLVHDERRWGEFVDAKVDAPRILRKELRESSRAPVFLSSASDPYQPVEARFKLTRRCLEELHAQGFPVIVLTRSPLVLRDLDILRRMEWVRVGCSISTAAVRAFEPGVPPLERRIETLRRLGEAGIRTWVSMAPVIPGMVTFDAEDLISKLREVGVGTVTPGLLRFQGYDASRLMFEASTGIDARSALEGADSVISKIRAAIAKEGFESPEEFFKWEEPPRVRGLDAFAERPANPATALPA